MPQFPFVTLDVFTQARYAGNPLALVRLPQNHGVSDERMQGIAREFNLSETIFLHEGRVGEDGVPEWRVRIFLTTSEIPFAGHPTIGCAVYALGTLANNARKGRLIANAGPIELDFADGVATASIPHNVHIHTQYPCTLKDLYGLQPALERAAISEDAIKTVSPVKGMNFLTVELPDLHALSSITTSPKPTPKLDDAWNVGFTGSYFYVLTNHSSPTNNNDNAIETYTLRTRMIEGSLEDPATGSAACALAASLALKRASQRVSRYEITQAVEMGRRSEIAVQVALTEARDAVASIALSGTAVRVMEGWLEC